MHRWLSKQLTPPGPQPPRQGGLCVQSHPELPSLCPVTQGWPQVHDTTPPGVPEDGPFSTCRAGVELASGDSSVTLLLALWLVLD